VKSIRVAFGKWGGRPHWEYDAFRLGDDEHGTWLGLPVGSRITRPGSEFLTSENQVVLVPDAAFVATFYAPGGRVPCDLYVDISTQPVLDGDTVRTIDLDLDVVRGWTGRIWVDDEDEFADHRVRFGYPDDVVQLAVDSCEEVRRAVEESQEPFDGPTAQRWLEVLDSAMMTR
jgi:predicted RNA-binding protein associated with RNAse of E/G family